MCDEKKITTKVCSCCGQEYPVSNFRTDSRSKDGYCHVCNSCKAQRANGILPVKGDKCNPALARFEPRELITELRARGYRGTLTYVITKSVVI